MATKVHTLEVYEELAAWYDRQGQAKLRDWFLVLAADIALSLGQHDDAERLRQRLLHVNPHHLLQPFSSFAEALQTPDVRNYVADLRRRYPLETAEQLLASTRGKRTPAAPTADPRDTEPLPQGEDRDLKVYRVAVPARKEPKPPNSTPNMPWTRQPRNAILPRPAPPAATEAPVPDEQDDDATTLAWWVSTILFALMLLVAASLAVYALIVPLFPV